MEKAEISRLINSFQAIKGYFDTTKKYMPQIAKLVFFIEEIIPLLQSIHKNIHQSTELIPSAAEKLDKVTSATELATTEVMDIVDNVISRLNQMTENVDALETCIAESSSSDASKEKIEEIRNQINGSQDDLFSIMNALQFQDITTQQINGIASVIDSVQIKLSELLQGFDDGGEIIARARPENFDPNAEFDFDRSAESQRIIDEFIKLRNRGVDLNSEDINVLRAMLDHKEPEENMDDVFMLDENGQPMIESLMNRLKAAGNQNG
jgi:chemotaxis regulatin CheY-phosphate phosphatase CheZ